MIKAKGPNTQINAACASTTQAIGIAEDWIRIGRCNRVIVIAADDASSENMLPWIGSGFLAAGGVTYDLGCGLMPTELDFDDFSDTVLNSDDSTDPFYIGNQFQ